MRSKRSVDRVRWRLFHFLFSQISCFLYPLLRSVPTNILAVSPGKNFEKKKHFSVTKLRAVTSFSFWRSHSSNSLHLWRWLAAGRSKYALGERRRHENERFEEDGFRLIVLKLFSEFVTWYCNDVQASFRDTLRCNGIA